MRLLLDTHVAVWAALNPERLTERERALMTGGDGPLVLSAVAVWELRLKWQSITVSGTRKGPIGPREVLTIAAAVGWQFLDITVRHAAAELAFALGHKDPFDDLLPAQAQEEGLRLMTRDAKLVGHPLAAPV